ncbi:hypothetical protein [Ruminococcus sp.]
MKSNGLKFEEETVATPAEITFVTIKSGRAMQGAPLIVLWSETSGL